MTREDIIQMAKQAGFSSAVGKHIALDDDLEDFAKLVAQHEREACAKLCEEYVGYGTRTEFAATIRARSNA
jgi:hypothetical protein